MIRFRRLREADVLLEVFVVANFAFLSLDIYIAHSINRFRHWAEWIPLGFSLLATVVLAPHAWRAVTRPGAWTPSPSGTIVGGAAIAVGILGMLLHLESHFFAYQTLRNLVYMAPFVAPLAYAGLGLLLLLNRMEPRGTRQWAQWVVFLALAGFVGNFALATLDHAQNGFFEAAEWIPVAASAYAIGVLLLVVIRPGDRNLIRFALAMLAIEVVVGLVGFYLHLSANLAGPSGWWENFLYGAPIFTPLLFPNLAVLAVLGLMVLARETPEERRPLPAGPLPVDHAGCH